MKIVIFKKKKINLGEQPVTEWTLLEYKKWLSIKLFHFHKTEGDQDRFHTHSFNAYSLLLKGDYIEEVIENSVIVKWREVVNDGCSFRKTAIIALQRVRAAGLYLSLVLGVVISESFVSYLELNIKWLVVVNRELTWSLKVLLN